MKRGFILSSLLVFGVCLGFNHAARADMSADNGSVATTTGAELRLIPPVENDAGLLLAALEMKLDEGFTTYWRMPGDSGIAPQFDWSDSENVTSVDVLWPAPLRHELKDDVTNIYRGVAVWPLRIRATDATKPIRLSLHMIYGVCSDICVPGEAKLVLPVPLHPASVSADDAALIESAVKRVPVPLPSAYALSLRMAEGKPARLEATLRGFDEAPDLFAEGPPDIWIGAPLITRRKDAYIYHMSTEMDADRSRKGMKIVLTLVERNGTKGEGSAQAYETVRILE